MTPDGKTLNLEVLKLAITMYAQLLTRLSTGVVSAYTPLLSWAIRFSWSHRSLAENTISSAGVTVVGDVEEVAILLEQPHLPSIGSQELADDDHPITPVTGDWAIVELGDLLLEHVDRLVAPLVDDLLLESFGLLAARS